MSLANAEDIWADDGLLGIARTLETAAVAVVVAGLCGRGCGLRVCVIALDGKEFASAGTIGENWIESGGGPGDGDREVKAIPSLSSSDRGRAVLVLRRS